MNDIAKAMLFTSHLRPEKLNRVQKAHDDVLINEIK